MRNIHYITKREGQRAKINYKALNTSPGNPPPNWVVQPQMHQLDSKTVAQKKAQKRSKATAFEKKDPEIHEIYRGHGVSSWERESRGGFASCGDERSKSDCTVDPCTSPSVSRTFHPATQPPAQKKKKKEPPLRKSEKTQIEKSNKQDKKKPRSARD